MWRKSLHDRYGYFDESFASSGDWEFWLRIAQDTKMLHIPEYFGLYLSSPQSIEHQNVEKKNKETFQIYQKYNTSYLSTVQDIDRGLASIHREMEREFPDKVFLNEAKDVLMQLKDKLKR